jgi:hypothetical protein
VGSSITKLCPDAWARAERIGHKTEITAAMAISPRRAMLAKPNKNEDITIETILR